MRAITARRVIGGGSNQVMGSNVLGWGWGGKVGGGVNPLRHGLCETRRRCRVNMHRHHLHSTPFREDFPKHGADLQLPPGFIPVSGKRNWASGDWDKLALVAC